MNAMGYAFTPSPGHASAIGADEHMSEVIDLFRSNPQLRALAVIDAGDRPIGIIREQRVRELLFCPFWFSLMQNPTIGGSIASMIEPCPVADVACSTPDLLRIVARSPGQQELILVRAGRFVETLDGGQLAKLAMLREVELAEERAARATHIDDAGRRFQQDITALTAALSEMARKVEAVAGTLSERARQTGSDAVTVAGALRRRSRDCRNSAIAVTRSLRRWRRSSTTDRGPVRFAAMPIARSNRRASGRSPSNRRASR